MALGDGSEPRLRIALLSTYHENAGDELARFGVQQQIASVLGRTPRWVHVSRSNRLSLHWPLARWSHAPLARMSPRQKRFSLAAADLMLRAGALIPDRLRNVKTLIVAGMPIFYFVGGSSFLDLERIYGDDWPGRIFTRIEPASAPRLIALGMGSIYDGSPAAHLAEHPDAAAFIRRFVARSALVTTRDEGTDALVRAAAPDARTPVLRSLDPGFWARGRFAIPVAPAAKRVSMSLTLESVNWDLSAPREIIVAERLRAFEQCLRYLRERGYEIELISHNPYGSEPAAEIAARYGVRAPRAIDVAGLIESVSRAELVVTWRVHGAVAARSAGRPTLLFRTDGRSAMAADVGAALIDDRTASPSEITAALDALRDAAQAGARETLAAADALAARELERIRGPLLVALRG